MAPRESTHPARTEGGHDPAIGAPLETRGRIESARRKWGQATLLGTLLALFFAPGLGFPILSGGPRYLTFAGATAGLALALTLVVRALRRNEGVVRHERGLVLVRGGARRVARFDDIERARFETRTRTLRLELAGGETLEERWPPRLGSWVVTCISEHLGSGPGASPR